MVAWPAGKVSFGGSVAAIEVAEAAAAWVGDGFTCNGVPVGIRVGTTSGAWLDTMIGVGVG